MLFCGLIHKEITYWSCILMSLEALRQIDGIDVDQGLVNCMDDEGLFLSVVGMYVEQIKEYLPSFISNFEQANFSEYGKLAHSVKGASASVGTHKVQALSQELEQAAKQSNFSLIEQSHQDYYSLLVTTVKQLEGAL